MDSALRLENPVPWMVGPAIVTPPAPGLISPGPLRGKGSCLPASEYLSWFLMFDHHGPAPANRG